MADNIKILGQHVIAIASTEETLYTVPDVTVATCSTLVVCNRGAGTETFRVSVAVAGAATGNKDYLFYDANIDAKSTIAVTIGMTLGQNDVVRVYASSTDINFNLFGVETDNT